MSVLVQATLKRSMEKVASHHESNARKKHLRQKTWAQAGKPPTSSNINLHFTALESAVDMAYHVSQRWNLIGGRDDHRRRAS